MRARSQPGVAGADMVEVRSATRRHVSWPLGPSGPAHVGSTRGGSTRGGRTTIRIVRTVQGSRWASTEALGIPIGTGATPTRTTGNTVPTTAAPTTTPTPVGFSETYPMAGCTQAYLTATSRSFPATIIHTSRLGLTP